MTQTKSADDCKVAWAAGLLDGEGSFKIYKGRVWIRCAMTDRPVLERLQVILGGTIHRHQLRPPRKMAWCWYCRHRDCRQTLERLRPHCVLKAPDIEELLRFLEGAA